MISRLKCNVFAISKSITLFLKQKQPPQTIITDFLQKQSQINVAFRI